MRRCFIHIGTFKTATTAIQQALAAGSASLEGRGILYARTGRPFGQHGQHNIALQMARDSRFRRWCGDQRRLLKEIKSFDGDVLLSSEDFQSALFNGDELDQFVRSIRDVGFEVVLIVYLRNQLSYLPSLYLTLVGMGMDVCFDAFVHSSIAGVFRFRQMAFTSDYCLF